jgi:hypothetical protein
VPVALDYETAEVAIFDQSGKLAAIAVVNADEKMLRPVKVLPMEDNA